MTLYVFNPEHDYALANDNEHFVAPQSAVQFARDCAMFPSYLFNSPTLPSRLYQPYNVDTYCVDTSTGRPVNNFDGITNVVPWGWDKLIIKQLIAAGVSASLLPTTEKMDKLRQLAHRQTASQALLYLHQHNQHQRKWPQPAQLLSTTSDIEQFINTYSDVILKSPYSGNGRGHLFAHGQFSPTLQRQCSGVLRKQGALLGEQMLSVKQDFALEFLCQNGQTYCCGYSLFNTKHYGYLNNILMSDTAIRQILAKWIAISEIDEVQNLLTTFIDKHIAPYYSGYLGVDMFVYEEDTRYFLQPVVEINLRMTMGMAAHILYQQFIHPEVQATLQIQYMSEPQQLIHYAQQQQIQRPLIHKDTKWVGGTTFLTPIKENTQYAVQIDIN